MNCISSFVRKQLRGWVFTSAIAAPLAAVGAQPPVSGTVAQPTTPSATVAPATLPTGGEITAGNASIHQSGNTTTITQQSEDVSLNWQSFNIGSAATVDFLQPNASAVAVNHITGTTGSVILGHLNANGQVYLLNPNGVLFGEGAQVNVGGLVASALDAVSSTAGSETVSLSGSSNGSVVNRGTLTAASGGYVALVGNQVSNQGLIRAQLGSIALAGGTKVTLSFDGRQLVNVQVDRSALNALAQNGQLIVADGGRVWMTAGARDSLLASAVNNTGTVEAQTVENHGGTITLLAGMQAGTVNVGGTLDASAPRGGNGGSIETSGSQVRVADGATVTTAAPAGHDGNWVIDPQDFIIATSGGDITPATLSAELTSGNVVISSTSGSHPGLGDVDVESSVAWSSPNTLTLQALNDIVFSSGVTLNGGSGALNLNAGNSVLGSGATLVVGNLTATAGGSINLPSASNAISALGPISAGGAVTIVDSTALTLSGSVNAQSLALTSSSGALTLAGGTIITAGSQNYSAPQIVLGADTSLQSTANGAIGFNGDIDGAHNLSITTGGPVTLAGVGNITPLTSLTLNAPASLSGNVTTTGAQTYAGPLTVGGNVALSGNGAILFDSTVDGSAALTVTTSGDVTFLGAIGGASPLSALNVTSNGGAIRQYAALTVLGPANFSTDSGAIILGTLNTGNLTVTSGATLNLGQGTVAGTLIASSNGAMNQNGPLTVTGAASFTQNDLTAGTSQDVILGSAGNNFQNTVTFASGAGAQINNLTLTNAASAPGALVLPASVGGNVSLDYPNASLTLPSLSAGGALTASAAGGISVDGAVAAPTIALSAGGNGIVLAAGASLGQAGATVDLTSVGGINENAAATITAATLQSSGGVTGAVSLTGTGNAIADLGGFSVTGNSFILSDSGALTISGAVSANSVTIGGSAGTTPSAITLAGTGSIAAPAIALSAGSLGVAFDSGASLGQAGATVDLTSGGSINENTGATITAATLQSSGGVTGAVSLTGAANAIADLGNFGISGIGNNFVLSDTGPLNISGAVSASSVAIGGSAGSTPSAITITGSGSVAAPAIALSAGGNGIVLAAGASLGHAGATVDLASAGGINENSGATITAATLQSLGTVTGAVSLTGAANVIGDLGNFTAGNSFILSDSGALNISGAVIANSATIGGSAGSTPSAITITGSGSIAAPAIALRAGGGGIALDNGAVLGRAGATVDLTSGGGISENAGARIVAATLQSSGGVAGGAATLTGTTNTIGALGSFSAAGFALTDNTALTVTGAVAGGPGATITDTGLLTVAKTGTVTANAVSLAAGSIAIDGVVSDGGAGTTSLLATAGTITEPGQLISGTLSGQAQGNALLTGSNTVAALGNFAVAGGANRFALDDAAALSVTGTVSAPGQVYLESSSAGGVTLAGGALAGGTLDSIQTNAFTIASGTVTGSTFELAPLTAGPLTLGSSSAGLSLSSVTGIGTSSVRLGAITLPGTVTPTTTASSITVAGAFGSGTVSLELDSLGGITQSAPLTAGTLSGTSGGPASLTASANAIGTLASFSAAGFTLTDSTALTVTGAVAGGPGVTISGAGSLTVTGAGRVTASAVSLTGSSIAIGGLVSDGGAGSTSLVATGGTITESGQLISGTLSGSATGAANLTAATNQIAALGPFSASGLAVVDGAGLTVNGAVAGGPSATITDAGVLTVGTAGSVSANAVSLTGTSISIDGLVSDGGAGTTSLVATVGAISEPGQLVSGTLSGSAGGSASLQGATPATNQIAALGNFSVAGGGMNRFALDDAAALSVTGTVSAPGQVYLESSSAGGVTLSPGGTLAGGTLDSIQTDAFAMASGTVTGSTFELAPLTPNQMTLGSSATGLSLPTLAGIGTASVRLGAVTLPGAATPTTTANAVTVAGAFGSGAVNLELDSSGGITQSAPLTAGTLSGTSGGPVLLTASANAIGTLASFSAADFTLTDSTALTVTGAVTGGPAATITDGGVLTVGAAGSVAANAVSLTGSSIAISGLVSDGGAGTTSLVATGGTITESGQLISGTLSGSATGATNLTGTNTIAQLTAFTAQGFTLNDTSALTVTGAVAGGPAATITDGGVLTVGTGGTVAASAVSLSGTGITIDGLVSDGGAGTTSLVATGGAITEPGQLTSGTLSGSATGAANLTGTNTIAQLTAFTAQGSVALLDDATLTLGAVSAGSVNIQTTTGNALLLAGPVTTSGSGDSLVLVSGGAFSNNAGATALNAGAGNWLVWSQNPAKDTLDGLLPNFKQYDAAYGTTGVLGTGNGLLYTYAPLISLSLHGSVTKTYDATAAAMLNASNYTVSGAIDGDTVTLASFSASYNSANVGTDKPVTTSGLAIANAANGSVPVYGYQLASTTATADIGTISPATLTYVANPSSMWSGQAPAGLGGTVTGLVGGQTLAQATTGTLTWSTPATAMSPPGIYAISGDGLSSQNYVFAEAPGNLTALTVKTASAPSDAERIIASLQKQLGENYAPASAAAAGPELHTPDIKIIGEGVRLQ